MQTVSKSSLWTIFGHWSAVDSLFRLYANVCRCSVKLHRNQVAKWCALGRPGNRATDDRSLVAKANSRANTCMCLSVIQFQYPNRWFSIEVSSIRWSPECDLTSADCFSLNLERRANSKVACLEKSVLPRVMAISRSCFRKLSLEFQWKNSIFVNCLLMPKSIVEQKIFSGYW